ncbi:hypothetical protein Emag_003595 [Eimeria magna]
MGGCQLHAHAGRRRVDLLGAKVSSLNQAIERSKRQEKRILAEPLPIGKEEAFHLAQEESILRAASLMRDSKALEHRCSKLRQEQLKRLRSLNAALPAEFRVT